ncbi:glutaminyl-peptide cyclotransferase [Gramella sp. KN1008]|nr:glutaminyl-peptide cyclotransferase [Gramella sp. KN1008]TBW28716.1 glutaminyl-peptide cyclotransferase [Gramella sp. KN1008]
MNKFNLLLVFTLSIFIFSCGSNNGKKKSDFSIQITNDQSEFSIDEKLQATIVNTKNRNIDSVSFYFGNKHIESSQNGNDLQLELQNMLLGNQTLKAIVYSEENSDTLTKNIKVLNDKAPVVYTYEILNSFPHDISSYTQGLEFHDGVLYESAGQYGESKLRKLELETGEVLNEIQLDDQYFAEGLTILNGNIYQLTWREDTGFIYDLEDFQKKGSFGYNQSKEGWGLCNNGEKIFKSDGTEKIWILDPETLAEQSYIQPTHHKSISTKLNELEWVNGKIYANTYQKDGVAIINPENGAIEGLINFSGLRDKVTQHNELDVLNGIAYNSETGKLYVTGKNWDKIFEVKIVKK